MRILLLILLIAISGLCVTTAKASPIVADLAVRSVDIDHNFDGLDVLMFGAQNSAGRIIVSLRGPKKNYIVRKKQRIAGIWANSKTIEFSDVNSLYSLAATHSLKEIHNDNLLNNFDLGLENLNFPAISKNGVVEDEQVIDEFRNALIDAKLSKKLYSKDIEKISFWGESLFRTNLNFPKNIGKGWYTAEIYLFSNGILSAIQSTPIHVSKTGIAAYIFDSAHNNSLIYGISCVLMALFAGWAANAVFGRR